MEVEGRQQKVRESSPAFTFLCMKQGHLLRVKGGGGETVGLEEVKKGIKHQCSERRLEKRSRRAGEKCTRPPGHGDHRWIVELISLLINACLL